LAAFWRLPYLDLGLKARLRPPLCGRFYPLDFIIKVTGPAVGLLDLVFQHLDIVLGDSLVGVVHDFWDLPDIVSLAHQTHSQRMARGVFQLDALHTNGVTCPVKDVAHLHLMKTAHGVHAHGLDLVVRGVLVAL
jgi:hypothetical protein